MINDMWEELEKYQPYADKHGFGPQWLKMTTERTPDVAWAAAEAARAAKVAARARAWVAARAAAWEAWAEAADVVAEAWAAAMAAEARAEAEDAAIQHIKKAIELKGKT